MTDTTPEPEASTRAAHLRDTPPRPCRVCGFDLVLTGDTEDDHVITNHGWGDLWQAVQDRAAENEQLRAALTLASGGDTARDTVRRLLAKASDHAKRAETAEARVATLEKVAADNRGAYINAVKDTRRAETERDEARARVTELETAVARLTEQRDEARHVEIQAHRREHAAREDRAKALARVDELLDRLAYVKGRCPACHGPSLFLGDGGYVTCARGDCPNPDAASTALDAFTTTAPAGTEETQ